MLFYVAKFRDPIVSASKIFHRILGEFDKSRNLDSHVHERICELTTVIIYNVILSDSHRLTLLATNFAHVGCQVHII